MDPETLTTVSTISVTENTTNNWNEIEKVTLSWNRINLYATDEGKCCSRFRKQKPSRKKHILKNLNGQAFPGTMLAIMGSSGSGKSTLLNALTGRSLPQLSTTGSILLNGKKDKKKLMKATAYVEQEDLFVGTLTVREHLIFQACLRMKAKVSYKDKLQRVEQVISEMGLISCSNNIIGIRGRIKGISGGERKRLAFASEILTNPSVMFCDEVTSGLDSFLSQSVISVLKNMSEAGRTVICVIHQPSSEIYASFDRVLFMAYGRTAFLGTREEAVTFFSRLGYQCPLNYNPADYIIQILAKIPGEEESCAARIKQICDEYEKNESTEEPKSEPSSQLSLYSDDDKKLKRYNASWFTQLRLMTWRSFINSRREPLLLKLRVFQTLIGLVMFAVFFWRQTVDRKGIMNIQSVMFMSLLNTSTLLMMSITSVFYLEMTIFFREYKSCLYGSDVFFLGKMIAEVSVTVIIPMTFSSLLYWAVGLYNDYRAFLMFVAVVVLCCNASASFAYFLSIAINSASGATGVVAAFIMPLSLLGGFFLNTGSIPFYLTWMKYISWFYYANEIININQWRHIKNITCPNEVCLSDGLAILKELGFDENHIDRNVLALICITLGWRIIAYIILLARARRWI